MTKKKKKKSSLKWVLLLISVLVLGGAFIFTFDKLVDPIGRSLLKKSYPKIYKALPKSELTWSLLDGIHIKSLRLTKLDPSISVIQAKGIWLEINYFSLLEDKITVSKVKIEDLYLKSNGNAKQALSKWLSESGNFLGKELRSLLPNTELKVISLRIQNREFTQGPVIHIEKLKTDLELGTNSALLKGYFQSIRLNKVQAQNGDFILALSTQGAELEVSDLNWKKSQIQITSKLKSQHQNIHHESQITFKELPFQQGASFIFSKSPELGGDLNGVLKANGPLLDWTRWIGNAKVKWSAFQLKNFGFQKSQLIQERAPLFSEINFESISSDSLQLKSGEIHWQALEATSDKFHFNSKGKINANGWFFLRGKIHLDQTNYEKLPHLTRKALTKLKDDSYVVALVMEGDLENQKIINIGSIVGNAVGNQIKSIGAGLRGIFQ